MFPRADSAEYIELRSTNGYHFFNMAFTGKCLFMEMMFNRVYGTDKNVPTKSPPTASPRSGNILIITKTGVYNDKFGNASE